MSDARDEIVDVIAKGMFGAEQCDRRQLTRLDENWESRLDENDRAEYRETAETILAALVDVYGEPEIENNEISRHNGTICGDADDPRFMQRIYEPRPLARRLVFPWQAVD